MGLADAAGASAGDAIEVEVIHCAARGVVAHQVLRLPPGSCVQDALRASGLWPTALDIGVHGRRAEPQRLLHAGDRVELYRPLMVAPGEARRERHRRAQREARAAAARGA